MELKGACRVVLEPGKSSAPTSVEREPRIRDGEVEEPTPRLAFVWWVGSTEPHENRRPPGKVQRDSIHTA